MTEKINAMTEEFKQSTIYPFTMSIKDDYNSDAICFSKEGDIESLLISDFLKIRLDNTFQIFSFIYSTTDKRYFEEYKLSKVLEKAFTYFVDYSFNIGFDDVFENHDKEAFVKSFSPSVISLFKSNGFHMIYKKESLTFKPNILADEGFLKIHEKVLNDFHRHNTPYTLDFDLSTEQIILHFECNDTIVKVSYSGKEDKILISFNQYLAFQHESVSFDFSAGLLPENSLVKEIEEFLIVKDIEWVEYLMEHPAVFMFKNAFSSSTAKNIFNFKKRFAKAFSQSKDNDFAKVSHSEKEQMKALFVYLTGSKDISVHKQFIRNIALKKELIQITHEESRSDRLITYFFKYVSSSKEIKYFSFSMDRFDLINKIEMGEDVHGAVLNQLLKCAFSNPSTKEPDGKRLKHLFFAILNNDYPILFTKDISKVNELVDFLTSKNSYFKDRFYDALFNGEVEAELIGTSRKDDGSNEVSFTLKFGKSKKIVISVDRYYIAHVESFVF